MTSPGQPGETGKVVIYSGAGEKGKKEDKMRRNPQMMQMNDVNVITLKKTFTTIVLGANTVKFEILHEMRSDNVP